MKDFLVKKILFLLVLSVAIILRFWNLGTVPPSPNWDEVALGYNAYSILSTGRDEYGKLFPLSLRSYDDYKPPLYVYLAVPAVYLFGLSTWATRLPAVIMGLFAVVGVYILSTELLKFTRFSKKNMNYTSLLIMFLFSISPWHLQFSRMAFEAGVGLSIVIWASVFFLKGLYNINFFLLSAFLYGLSLYAYHSQRIFVPLLVFLFTIIFRKELIAIKKKLILPVFIGILTLLPLIPILLDTTTLTRLHGTSAIADQTGLLASSVFKLEQAQKNNDYLGMLFNNRRVIYAKTIIDGYLSHFSLGWLFIRGDNARHHAPDMGLMYLWELPFLLFGIYSIWKMGGKIRSILFGWFLLSPIAASPTTELPHAIRNMTFLPMLQFAVGCGAVCFYQIVKNIHIIPKLIIISFTIVFAFFGFANYLSLYHSHQNLEFSEFWQYGYSEAIAYVKEQASQYDKVVVSTKLEQPYMFFLYFLRYDPKVYLQDGGTASGGFAENKNSFSKFEFRPIFWEKEIKDGKYLYIGTSAEIPNPNKKSIYYLNGKEAMRIAD